jgi:MOSC domain-containing protein YiiM
MSNVLSVNVARLRPNPGKGVPTGIDKRPTARPVAIRAPGSMADGLGSGLVGDAIGNHTVHGGDDQAVYAYAREDLDTWQHRLDRPIANGQFGENFTTAGIEVTGAKIGERWQVGSAGLLLEVSRPRIPCRTFVAWLDIAGWMKTFTAAAVPGAYLRVITPGTARASDRVVVVDRPDHDVTVGMVFRALTLEPELLPHILDAEALAEETKDVARRRT